jgi:16S rRNA (adenine1518-N6/adenine1519-N6)-dimethyltransferase
MAALGLHPRRRLGQSFLADPRLAERIVAAAGASGRRVLEIGPGLGALTGLLAARASSLVAIEIDRAMAARLRERFAGGTSVRVVEGDALAVDLDECLGPGEPAIVVANLPYSAATAILFRLFAERRRFSRLVVMLQREVAARLVARPGGRDYGVLSISAQLVSEPRILFPVSPAAFVPRPRVESAVVSLEILAATRVPLADEERFRAIVRAAFGQRRKTLRRALAGVVSAAAFERAGIDAGRRGETLAIEEFARLAGAAS